MADRDVPVRPNLDQLKHQAKDLLRDVQRGDAAAVAEFRKHGPASVEPAEAKLAHAQFALARSYGVASWARLATACKLIHGIWENDVKTVRELVLENPELLKEDARGVKGNWGPPMSYAANLGRDEVIEMLRGLGAEDLQFAFDRACLQSKLETAKKLYDMGARPTLGCVMGPCETLSASGLRFLLELGAEFADEKGDRLKPIGLILETYGRNPRGKHECLDLVEKCGPMPDSDAYRPMYDDKGTRIGVQREPRTPLFNTAPVAVHRGRLDLLEDAFWRDQAFTESHTLDRVQWLSQTFPHEAIYPESLGCSKDKTAALHGTPLDGTTLLHMCVDFDEIQIAKWLLDQGVNVDTPARLDSDGFGGHTALFGCVVSQTYRVHCRKDLEFIKLLLDHGADVNVRASLRKELRGVRDETLHEYRDVTPLSWGLRFHDQDWVNPKVIELIRERGAHE